MACDRKASTAERRKAFATEWALQGLLLNCQADATEVCQMNDDCQFN